MNEISDVMKETMSKIKEMVDVNTICLLYTSAGGQPECIDSGG